MKNFLSPLFSLFAVSFGNLQAQSATDEYDMQAFARNFMSAYNQGNYGATYVFLV